MERLTLSCRLNKSDALVFSNIVVSPFIGLSSQDTATLNLLFQEGHLKEGQYCLAGYPDRGPRAILKIGFTGNVSVYSKDIDSRQAAEAVYFERGKGIVGDIHDVIQDKQGRRIKVAEVWWFHGSPTAEHEWHSFMETFAHQMNEQIFFAPVKADIRTGPLDFSKARGSDAVTVTIELQGKGKTPMNRSNARELGKAAAKHLHDWLTEIGILEQLIHRIVAAMPKPVQEAYATDASMLPMFGATAGQYAMCFGCGRLAVNASTMFTKRILGFIPVPDKAAWSEFTEGVIEYATESMQHPATRGDIIEDINDHQNAVTRFCKNYPPEARPVLIDAVQQIEQAVSIVLGRLDK